MVSPSIFESAGKRSEHVLPGVYSRSANVSSASGVSAGNLAIIGESLGGAPKKLMVFGSYDEAKDSLVGGELLDAIGYAFKASKDYTPSKIYAMRVNSGVQSTYVDKAGDGDTGKTVYAWDYGAHTNLLNIKVEAGTLTGSKKITIGYKDNKIVKDNIIRESFSIKATSSSISVSVASTGVTVGTNTYDFATYSTIGELVAKLNTVDGVSAEVLGSDDDLTAELDYADSASVSTTGKTFYSNLQAQIEALESIDYIAKVVLGNNASRTEFANTTGIANFTGGSTSETGSTDFVDALTALAQEDINIIATPSTDSAVHAAISAHCTEMSNVVNRKERTAILGAQLGTNDDNGKNAAKAFNSSRVSYVIDSAYMAHPSTGVKTLVSGAIVACVCAAMESAMAVNEALTFKEIGILEVSKKRSVSNIESLILAGIMVVNPNPQNLGQNIIIRGVTTSQKANDLIASERSMIREADYMDRDLRNRLSGGIGHPNFSSADSAYATLEVAADEWNKAGYIIKVDDKNVWDVQLIQSGDKVKIKYSRCLTAPLNFMFVTANNYTYSSTVEL